ncbi:hypothetical protein [Flagellimonas sp.]|uniref:hypothetical protein n=1 Tax=Flagellimonas sp. TaxID=2058762 RepID=UPI003B5B8B50
MSCSNPNQWYKKPITNHSELSDVQFENLFEKGDLPPSLFDHEAHLRLAWLYITKYGEKGAVDKSCSEIRQFDKLHGDGTKFNTTVTIAAVKTVQHFMKKSNADDFYGFIKEFPRLKHAFKALLDQHYAFDIFSNERARTSYMEPDIQPFD